MKRLILSLLLLAAFAVGFAQVPSITSFTPAAAKPGDVVTLTGTGFNATAANNVVFFGATRATVTAASATSVAVTVPTGATYAPITLLNTGSVLACASLSNFNPIYAPAKTDIATNDFLSPVDFQTGSAPRAIAIGDLDGDGKPDLVVVNFGSFTVSVLRNISASGSITAGSFAPPVDFSPGGDPYSVAIGDLDGDGKLDLAVANVSSNIVSVYRNTSTIGSITAGSFAPQVDFATGANPTFVAIGDLDGDGKPDLALANGGSNTVSVLSNTSAVGSITAGSFAPKVDFGTGVQPNSVAISDLDGDGKPDLAVTNRSSNTVSVLRNTSISGSITAGSFAPKVDFSTGVTPISVAIGDLDGDGKPDLAVTNAVSNTVSVYRNTSASGSIAAGSFAPKVDFSTGVTPISVAIGDLDGDGKPDLAVTVNNFTSTISVYRNTSSIGSITAGSFAPKVDFLTLNGSNPLSVAIGDLDGDGKPDLVVANYAFNYVSVYRNADLAAITSFTPASGCAGTGMVTITGTNFTGVTGVSIGGTAASSFTVDSVTQITAIVGTGTTGTIQVTTPSGILVSSGNFTVLPVPAAPVAGSNSPIAPGGSINLSASAISGATYSWTGPNGFTSSQQNPIIPNATQANSGLYTVVATVNGCASSGATATVVVGSSGGSCNPNLNAPLGSISPNGTLLPIITPNVNYNEAITFHNWDSVTISGLRVRMDYVIIDSIINLPCGIGWASSQTDNKFLNQEYGCIYLNGTTNDAVGQYNLKVKVRLKVSLLPTTVPYELSSLGIFMAVRVCNTGANCPAIDTALTGLTTTCNTGAITPPASLSVNLGADQSVCAGTALNINPAVQGGTVPYTYNWSSSSSPLSCYTCSSSSITVTSASQVVLVVTDANGLIARDSIVYNIAQAPATPNILGNTNITPQTPYNYSVSSVGGVQYTWTAQNGSIQSGQGTNSVSVVWSNNGPYTLQLTLSNAANCSSSAYLTVTNSGGCNIPVNVTTVSSNPICTGDTILLIASAAAGTSYQWLKNGNNITGANNDTLKVTATGTYQVQVSNGTCAIVSSGYIFTFEPSPITPVILGSANVTGCSQQPVNLTVNNTYPSYLWSNGATTAAITITTSGNYVVTVTAVNGCKAVSAPVAINQSVAAAPAICAVSVDAASGGNLVVWEKLNTAAVDSYYIYKESNQFNVFNKIGAKGVNEFSTFVDVNANPAQQADRYSISILDTCGNLTVQSAPHKTIHLTINQGLGGAWNLIWNHYEGFAFGSYNIYRGTTSGNLAQIATISSGNSSYTDLSPPINTLFYQIEAVNPVGCTPTAKQSGYASSLSNIVSTDPNGIAETDVFLRIALYPNPTQGNFMLDIQSTNQLNAFVYVTDVIGTEVINKRIILAAGKNTIEMGLGEFTNGLYLVRLLDANGNSLGSYKIVKH